MERSLEDICVPCRDGHQLGPVVRLVREGRLHMREVASVIGVSTPAYNDFERGRILFRREIVEHVGNILGVGDDAVFRALVDVSFNVAMNRAHQPLGPL